VCLSAEAPQKGRDTETLCAGDETFESLAVKNKSSRDAKPRSGKVKP
jgi:hypothetical protein